MVQQQSLWAAARRNIAHSIRQTLAHPYGRAQLRADVLASLVVGMIALPLSMALGIASGVPPEHGLYTAIVAGFVAALLGGAPRQVTGPTAAFVVLLVPVTSRYGLGGLAIASLMAGVWLLLMGLFRLGGLVRYVPTPVTLGFTGGIAVVIATLQIKDFFGLSVAHMPESYTGKVAALAAALPTARLGDTLIGLMTLGLLLAWPRVTAKLPAPLVALGLASVAAYALSGFFPQLKISTIEGRFSYVLDGVRHAGIPRTPPWPTLRWLTHGPHGRPLILDAALVRALLPASFGIALLAAIESLLAAVVADRMGRTRHNSDAELLGVGIANIVSPFFGGFAATGAIARTAANIRSGACSPVAAVLHALFVLITMMVMAPLLGHLPMASLAALLLTVAWNMGEPVHLLRAFRNSAWPDALVLCTCLTLTVAFDMVVSIAAGVVLAALLFSRGMARSSHTQVSDGRTDGPAHKPGGVWLCAVRGPLFFGTAEPALAPVAGAIEAAGSASATLAPTVVIDLNDVPYVDATGVAHLQDLVAQLQALQRHVVLVRPAPQADAAAFVQADWPTRAGSLALVDSRAQALGLTHKQPAAA
jgi:SulP family sulfate permease